MRLLHGLIPVFVLAAACGTSTSPGDASVDAIVLDLTTGCSSDTDCSGATPRCHVPTRQCVPCLLSNDNCTGGKHCFDRNGTFVCSASCRDKADCMGGGECCTGACLDLTADPKNCGACGHACAIPNGTSKCAAGQCVVDVCFQGFNDCDGKPENGCEADLLKDNAHCGGCATDCGVLQNAKAVCSKGACVILTCSTNFSDCDNKAPTGCEANTTIDPANCGGCGMLCPTPNGASPVCVAGRCGIGPCQMGFGDCDKNANTGCEVSLNDDVTNCGSCFNRCVTPSATPACMMGACAIGKCNQGFSDCDGAVPNGCEIQTATNPNHCGMCGKVCAGAPNANPACLNSACGIACKPLFGDCDKDIQTGCEAPLAADLANCGVCSKACPIPANATPSCANGMCGIAACKALFGNCDNNLANGCEASLATDIKNCGQCGKACTTANGTPSCTNSACGIKLCSPGFDDCDKNVPNGCEVSTSSDPQNCGACGNVCPQDLPNCSNGVCNAQPVLVGQFSVYDGPFGWDNPPTYTCLEACALIFGGQPNEYSCSTSDQKIDHMCWMDSYDESYWCYNEPLAEDFKQSDFWDCQQYQCSFSAYVWWDGCDSVNYCWK